VRRTWLWFGSEGVSRRKQPEAQTEAARCLTLLTNCVLLWNAVYRQEVLRQRQAGGCPVNEAHFEYLSPSRCEHTHRLGKYSFTNPAQLDPSHRRPLRHPSD